MPKPFLQKKLVEFPNNRDFALSQDLKEAYFTAQSPNGEVSVIMQLKKGLKKTSIASFSGQFMDIEPFLSSDGLKLYYASNRPKDGSSVISDDFDIWFVERENRKSEWSIPINIGMPINSDSNEFYPAIATNGNFYFTSDRSENSKGKDDIYVSFWQNSTFQNPISLNSSINSEGYEFNAL